MNSENDELTAAMAALASEGWFSQRSAKTQKRLSRIARLRNFKADEPIYLAGDMPNGVFGLVSGTLTISFPRGDGEDYVVHRAGAGFWFGDLALFSTGARLVSIHAAKPTTAVQFTTQDLDRLVQEDPSLYADFYQMTYENFSTAFRVITNLAIPSPDKRVADRLILEAMACADPEGWMALSQPDLAQLTAMSVPTLQRVMARLTREGLVEQGYGRMRVLDRKGLRRVCQE